MEGYIKICAHKYDWIEGLRSKIGDFNNGKNICKCSFHCDSCTGISEDKIINMAEWYSERRIGLELILKKTQIIYPKDYGQASNKNTTRYELLVACDRKQYEKKLLEYCGETRTLKVDLWT